MSISDSDNINFYALSKRFPRKYPFIAEPDGDFRRSLGKQLVTATTLTAKSTKGLALLYVPGYLPEVRYYYVDNSAGPNDGLLSFAGVIPLPQSLDDFEAGRIVSTLLHIASSTVSSGTFQVSGTQSTARAEVLPSLLTVTYNSVLAAGTPEGTLTGRVMNGVNVVYPPFPDCRYRDLEGTELYAEYSEYIRLVPSTPLAVNAASIGTLASVDLTPYSYHRALSVDVNLAIRWEGAGTGNSAVYAELDRAVADPVTGNRTVTTESMFLRRQLSPSVINGTLEQLNLTGTFFPITHGGEYLALRIMVSNYAGSVNLTLLGPSRLGVTLIEARDPNRKCGSITWISGIDTTQVLEVNTVTNWQLQPNAALGRDAQTSVPPVAAVHDRAMAAIMFTIPGVSTVMDDATYQSSQLEQDAVSMSMRPFLTEYHASTLGRFGRAIRAGARGALGVARNFYNDYGRQMLPEAGALVGGAIGASVGLPEVGAALGGFAGQGVSQFRASTLPEPQWHCTSGPTAAAPTYSQALSMDSDDGDLTPERPAAEEAEGAFTREEDMADNSDLPPTPHSQRPGLGYPSPAQLAAATVTGLPTPLSAFVPTIQPVECLWHCSTLSQVADAAMAAAKLESAAPVTLRPAALASQMTDGSTIYIDVTDRVMTGVGDYLSNQRQAALRGNWHDLRASYQAAGYAFNGVLCPVVHTDGQQAWKAKLMVSTAPCSYGTRPYEYRHFSTASGPVMVAETTKEADIQMLEGLRNSFYKSIPEWKAKALYVTLTLPPSNPSDGRSWEFAAIQAATHYFHNGIYSGSPSAISTQFGHKIMWAMSWQLTLYCWRFPVEEVNIALSRLEKGANAIVTSLGQVVEGRVVAVVVQPGGMATAASALYGTATSFTVEAENKAAGEAGRVTGEEKARKKRNALSDAVASGDEPWDDFEMALLDDRDKLARWIQSYIALGPLPAAETASAFESVWPIVAKAANVSKLYNTVMATEEYRRAVKDKKVQPPSRAQKALASDDPFAHFAVPAMAPKPAKGVAPKARAPPKK